MTDRQTVLVGFETPESCFPLAANVGMCTVPTNGPSIRPAPYGRVRKGKADRSRPHVIHECVFYARFYCHNKRQWLFADEDG